MMDDSYYDDPDDYYSHYIQQQVPYRSHSYSYSDETPSLRSRLMDWLDYLTGPKFAILIAILVVLIFQFKDPVLRWFHFYFRSDVSLSDSLIALWWQALDFLRACWQISHEYVRSVSHISLRPTTQTRRLRGRIRKDTMPELEEVAPEEKAETTTDGEHAAPSNGQHHEAPSTPRPLNEQELEPAFLNENDYPPGWMVYHKVLGVVSKTEADRYDSEQLRRDSTPEVQEEEAPKDEHPESENPDLNETRQEERKNGPELPVLQSIHAH